MRLKNWLEVFEYFRSRNIKVIHISALESKIDLKGKSLSVALNRLEKANVIKRVAKGWICIAPCEIWEITKVVFPSSYISLEWALHYHDLLDQEVKVITLVWLGKTKKLT